MSDRAIAREPLQEDIKGTLFAIEGMDCGSCAAAIENHLKTVKGVSSVQVHFASGRAVVQHDGSPEAIVNEVKKIGYRASVIERGGRNQTKAQSANWQSPLVLSGVLLALGFAGSRIGAAPGLAIVLYALSIVAGGYKPARSAYYAVKSKSLDMNVLMTAAVIGAAAIGEWLEGATVVWLFALGNALQSRSIARTRDSIRSLMDLAPPEAWVQTETGLEKKHVNEVQVRDRIVVKPGERIPLDGIVADGDSTVNQAPITGESVPVEKTIGDPVYAGTINEHGRLTVTVTKPAHDTALAKIISLVEEAQDRRAPTQAFVDRFAGIYTPIVFAAALIVIVLPPILGVGSWGEWLYRGLELLVIACPCALVISTPVAVVSAIGNAARNGVLIKGGAFLEVMGEIDTIAFDKTGTLTEGRPSVDVIHAVEVDERRLLAISRTLEEFSTHPIAHAIVRRAEAEGIETLPGEQFRNIVGRGVQAKIEGEVHYAGNPKLFEQFGLALDMHRDRIHTLQQQGCTVVVIGTSTKLLGYFGISDTIRDTSLSALKGLAAVGVSNVVMLTGDHEGTARKLASEMGIAHYRAELLPEGKVDQIERLKQEGRTVAMVGDGINDAPALAAANLGIAMGGAGTDTAMETADIVLMADNLSRLPHTVKLSRMAMRIIKQNIWFSILIKVAAIALIVPGWLTLWMAILSDTGAALLVILNSMRLLRFRGST